MNIIEKGNYEGYVWMSDESAPRIISGEYENRLDRKDEPPFIIEAMLYDVEHQRSVSVKYSDGEYLVNDVCIQGLGNLKFDEQKLSGNKMGGKVLVFRTYWRPVSDPMCCGMDVLTAAEAVFMGFDKGEVL